MYPIHAIGRFAAIAITAVFALLPLSGCGQSATSPYVFSTSAGELDLDGDPVVDVSITRNGKPVENAVVFEMRFDMAPDGMREMTADATPQGSPAPGVYRFAVKPSMGGRWELKLGAKVQGEAETVRGSVIVTAHRP
jgi:hypothetical protein